jgi:peptide-methionine (S)-S-oxide reductase
VVTPVLEAGTFWIAEDYHQDYYKGSNIILTRAGPKTQANAYKFYRNACGRDARVLELWGAEAFPGK